MIGIQSHMFTHKMKGLYVGSMTLIMVDLLRSNINNTQSVVKAQVDGLGRIV